MQIRPTALTTGLIIHSFIALFYVYTEFGIDSYIRSEQGAKDFLTIKSFLSTAAKAGSTAFQALLSLFQGQFVLGTE